MHRALLPPATHWARQIGERWVSARRNFGTRTLGCLAEWELRGAYAPRSPAMAHDSGAQFRYVSTHAIDSIHLSRPPASSGPRAHDPRRSLTKIATFCVMPARFWSDTALANDSFQHRVRNQPGAPERPQWSWPRPQEARSARPLRRRPRPIHQMGACLSGWPEQPHGHVNRWHKILCVDPRGSRTAAAEGWKGGKLGAILKKPEILHGLACGVVTTLLYCGRAATFRQDVRVAAVSLSRTWRFTDRTHGRHTERHR